MKAMPILPTALLRDFGTATDFHFCLAHMVLQNPTYANFFNWRSQRGEFVTMDNGAYENATLSGEQLWVAARVCGAQEVFLPDVLADCDATLSAVEDAFSEIPVWYKGNIAVIPQGRNLDDFIRCMRLLVQDYGDRIDTIGIPKHMEDKHLYGRIGVMLEATKQGLVNVHRHQFHMLGVYSTMAEVTGIANALPFIRSIDSAGPVHLALFKRPYYLQPIPARPENFFDIDTVPSAPGLRRYIRRFITDAEVIGNHEEAPVM